MAKTTSRRANPDDAALFELLARHAALDRAIENLDKKFMACHDDPKRAAYDEQSRELIGKLIDLEWPIVVKKVFTLRGFKAKCRLISRTEFDPSDAIAIAFFLGRDAERLGITTLPEWIRAIPTPCRSEIAKNPGKYYEAERAA